MLPIAMTRKQRYDFHKNSRKCVAVATQRLLLYFSCSEKLLVAVARQQWISYISNIGAESLALSPLSLASNRCVSEPVSQPPQQPKAPYSSRSMTTANHDKSGQSYHWCKKARECTQWALSAKDSAPGQGVEERSMESATDVLTDDEGSFIYFLRSLLSRYLSTGRGLETLMV